MPAGTLNLTIEQGATFTNNMTVTVDSNTDITNFTFSGDERLQEWNKSSRCRHLIGFIKFIRIPVAEWLSLGAKTTTLCPREFNF